MKEIIVKALETYGLSGAVDLKGLARPVRLGVVLDAARRAENRRERYVQAGRYRVDTQELLFLGPKSAAVKLTEKEMELLVLLAGAAGAPVERKAVLEQVWGYAEGVETHTLETHVYRLRQKIEKDPANPKIVVTDGEGYKISLV